MVEQHFPKTLRDLPLFITYKVLIAFILVMYIYFPPRYNSHVSSYPIFKSACIVEIFEHTALKTYHLNPDDGAKFGLTSLLRLTTRFPNPGSRVYYLKTVHVRSSGVTSGQKK